MREAVVSAAWGEVVRGGRKIEGWAWDVDFLVDGVVVDRHCYKSQALARNSARLFEEGAWHFCEYGGVEFA